MADLETFRAEVAAWLEANAPKALLGKRKDPLAETNGGKKWKFHYPESKEWLDMMAAKGWTAPTWPKECGGAGLSNAEAHVIREEVARLDLPPPLTGQNFGLYMIGAMMVERASEEQKREHLPKIAAGEIRWCQGYSEPNAGSDLASVQTTAVRDGDEYVLNGQKVWTSYGDESDWMFLIARTDPDAKKQEGITFFLMDLETPGVEVRPIKLISGASPFCETFYDDCRVPARNVVGELNDGWTIAKALLEHERKMISGAGGEAMGGIAVNPTLLMHRYLGVDEDGKIADPVLRDQITQLSFDGLCYILTTARARDEAHAGQSPGALSSMFKVYGTELNQRMEEMDMKIRGPQALGWEGEGFEDDELTGTRSWLRSRGNSIEGGTSEIQRNIIAKRVLHLPEEYMDLALNDEQRMLLDSARSFIDERSPLSRIRDLRDADDPLGYTPAIWNAMAELGWHAIPFPEDHGGLGLGMAEVVLVTEAMGRALAPEPYLSSVILGGQLLLAAGSDAQRGAWLPGIVSGEKRLTVAHQEIGSRYALAKASCRAERTADGFAVTGEKTQVLDANDADGIIVVARTSGEQADEHGLTLLLVPLDTPGVRIVRQHRLDSRNAAKVVFTDARLPETTVVGAVDEGLAPLTQAVDRATVALCGEMLGAMSRAFEMTLDYLRERKQFDVHIGSFQSLQHRAANMFMETELARTATMVAARTMDAGDPGAPQAVSVAKARCSDAFLQVANEGVQMFAGIGMTDEHDIGFFMKRARVCDMTFGDAAHHRNRWSTLNGF